MGNSTNLIVNCIVFSMSCIVILLGLIVSYDIVRYTLFGRRYLRVRNSFYYEIYFYQVDGLLLLLGADLLNHRETFLLPSYS